MSDLTYYWSRCPGKFVVKNTGKDIHTYSSLSDGPSFSGNVGEWYQTLIETIINVDNKLLEMRQMFEMFMEDADDKAVAPIARCDVRVGPEVLTIIEFSASYRPNMSAGATLSSSQHRGTLQNWYDVYVDYDMPRDEVRIMRDKFFVGTVKVLDLNII